MLSVTYTIAMVLGILDILRRALSVTAMSGAGEMVPFRSATLAGGSGQFVSLLQDPAPLGTSSHALPSTFLLCPDLQQLVRNGAAGI